MYASNGDVKTELPEAIARLLIKHRGWDETEPPESIAESDADTGGDTDEQLIPMTHVPGVIPTVSMRDIKRWVDDGTVPHRLRGRTKLVRLSAVRATVNAEG